MAAALAIGMSRMQAYRYVILPQALRRMTPILLTQSIALFQDSSLVYVIGLHDFMTSVGIVGQSGGALDRILSVRGPRLLRDLLLGVSRGEAASAPDGRRMTSARATGL